MSDDADAVERWLHGYLVLDGIVPIGERVTWPDGSPALVIAAACWADGFDLFIAADSLGSSGGPVVFFESARDDLGNEYAGVGATGGGGSGRGRANWTLSFTPRLDARVRRIELIPVEAGPNGRRSLPPVPVPLPDERDRGDDDRRD